MRATTLGLLMCGVLVFGACLAACGASPNDDGSGGRPSAGAPPTAGAPPSTAGANSSAGASSTAGAGNSAGATNSGGQSGTTSAGASGLAGSAGSSQAGGAGAGGAGGASGGGAGAPGVAGSLGAGGAPSTPALKFVVYIDDYTGSWTSWASKVDFSKVTHLNLAFMKATTNNDWQSVDGQSDADIKALVEKAHAAGAKVLASLGGGGTDTTVSDQYKNPNNDDALVNNLDAFLKRLNLDGADIDIEKESKAEVGDNYGTFVSKVVAKLHPEGKLVTAAVAQYLQPAMNDATLHLFDFVNIMIYANNTNAYQSELDFYVGKGMAKTQLTLGIISESGNHTSAATTKSITTLSKSYGGAMLWDLAEDSTGSASVYKAMQDSF